jgi:hypothetical protein
MVCVAVDELPHASVAVHVLVIENDPAHAPGVVTSLKVRVGLGSHRSVAVGVAHDGVASQSIVEEAGSALIAGGVTSCTLIVCVAVELLPHASVAVHVLVIENDPAHAPGVVTSLKVSAGLGSHRSVAVGVVHDGVASQSIVVAAGSADIAGGVTSCTLMVCVAVDELPHASVAVHVLVIENDPAHAPGVVTSLKVSVGLGSHRSVAVGVVHDGAASQSIVVAPGREEIAGGVTSCTLMV